MYSSRFLSTRHFQTKEKIMVVEVLLLNWFRLSQSIGPIRFLSSKHFSTDESDHSLELPPLGRGLLVSFDPFHWIALSLSTILWVDDNNRLAQFIHRPMNSAMKIDFCPLVALLQIRSTNLNKHLVILLFWKQLSSSSWTVGFRSARVLSSMVFSFQDDSMRWNRFFFL